MRKQTTIRGDHVTCLLATLSIGLLVIGLLTVWLISMSHVSVVSVVSDAVQHITCYFTDDYHLYEFCDDMKFAHS